MMRINYRPIFLSNFNRIFEKIVYNRIEDYIDKHKYILFTGWEVILFGRNCARGRRPRAVFQTEGTVSPNTDRPLIFFSYWDLKVSGKFSFTLQPICVEVGRVCVDEARGRLQTKTKHYNMTFSSVIYFKALTALF